MEESMKSLLLASGFEEFITGNGIWILVGCLAAALLVSVVFLILNIEKEKKLKEKQNAAVLAAINAQKSEVAEKAVVAEEAEEAEVAEKAEVKEEKVEEPKKEAPAKAPAKKAPAKAPAKKAPAKKAPAKAAVVAEEKVEEKPAAKPVAKKAPAKKVEEKQEVKAEKPVAKKAPAKKVEKVEEPVAEENDEKANYEIVYDAENREWRIRKEGSVRAIKITKTKQEAIDYAKPLADKNEVKLIVHTKND